MKILLALDTSPIAGETIATVQRMFGSSGSSVVVLSVVGPNEPEQVPSPVLLASVAQNLAVLDAAQVRTHEEIVAHASQTLREAGLVATGEVGYGDPRHVLVSAARSHAADLIVMGSHGHSAVQQLMMGTVASYVVNHAPCNVLVVRHVKETTRG
jgi:nucleotide-binding universal stress UspA family protein